MATDDLDERLARLAAQLDAAGDAADPATRLARALLDRPASALSHAAVQEALPDYLEARLRGAPASAGESALQRHLNSCAECAALYAMLLDREAGPAASAASLPAPDLSRLPGLAPAVTLRGYVTAVVADLLAVLRPTDLPDLSYLADAFFDNLPALPPGARLGPALTAVLGAGGQGRVQPPAVTRYLAATLLATEELRGRVGPGQAAALAAAGQLEAVARPVAHAAANAAGLDRNAAGRFADEYVRRLLASPAELDWIPPDEPDHADPA